MKRVIGVWLAALLSAPALGTPPDGGKGSPGEHTKKDIERHRAMATAHEAAARCLESGKGEEVCLKALQAACKGLAIGKHCGMRHGH